MRNILGGKYVFNILEEQDPQKTFWGKTRNKLQEKKQKKEDDDYLGRGGIVA